MKSKMLSDIEGRREWAVILDTGDEAKEKLETFAAANELVAAHFTGIGAFAAVTVGWFDLEAKQYRPIEIGQQVEVLSLIGDVAESKGKPGVHAHVCLAKRDGSAHGGHLLKGIVRPTLELIVVESPAHLRKSFRSDLGLALIDLDRSSAQSRPSAAI